MRLINSGTLGSADGYSGSRGGDPEGKRNSGSGHIVLWNVDLVKLISALLIFISQSTFAQKDTRVENGTSARTKVERFLEELTPGNEKEAVDNLFMENRWMSFNDSKKNEIISKFVLINSNVDQIGKLCTFEIIKEECMGQSMCGYVCSYNYQRQPFRIVIIMYRPEVEWMTYSLDVDDMLDDYLEDKLKMAK